MAEVLDTVRKPWTEMEFFCSCDHHFVFAGRVSGYRSSQNFEHTRLNKCLDSVEVQMDSHSSILKLNMTRPRQAVLQFPARTFSKFRPKRVRPHWDGDRSVLDAPRGGNCFQRGLLELKDLPQAEAQARKVVTMELSETTGWDSQENDDLGIFW